VAIKLPDGRYKCSWCNKIYPDPSKADTCRGNHDIVYVPMLRSDVNRLLQFISTKDDKLLTKTLHQSLTRFLGKVV
jgi:hypothetical protein